MKPTPDLLTIPRTIKAYALSLVAQALTDSSLTQLPQGRATPVFVATGLFGPKQSTNQLIRFLRKNDYDARRLDTNFHLPSRKGEPPYGEAFARGVQERYVNTGKKVHLVGWSLGGLAAKMYAQRHPEQIAGIYTIASPLKNIQDSSYLTHLEPLFAFFERNSLTKELLEELEQPSTVEHYSYVATRDEIVDPNLCTSKHTRYIDTGHLAIGFSPELYVQLIKDLSANTPGKIPEAPLKQLDQLLSELELIVQASN